MQNLDPAMTPLLDETVEASRHLGSDPFTVLHGGGNTSAKDDDFLWAKASGFDLGELTREGLVQLRRPDLEGLLTRPALSDTAMMDGYAAATVLPGQPAPTIEALLHHALPFPSVLHSHADAIVALTNTVHGMDLVAQVFGDEVTLVPYVMPGFDLAKLATRLWHEAGGRTRALVLQHHGLFTMGHTVTEALDLHLDLLHRAEQHIAATGFDLRAPFEGTAAPLHADAGAGARALIEGLQEYTDTELTILQVADSEVRTFIDHPHLARLARTGPTTLEHVIRTKRVPLLGGDTAEFVEEYRKYFERHADPDHVMLSPVPRVVLHEDLGLLAVGDTPKAARIILDIYRHTIRLITAAELLGGYRTISEAQAFDIEYWELEQRRLK